MYPGWGPHEPLLTAFAAHHAAVIRNDGLAARLRDEPADEDLLDRSLTAADEVIATRARLYQALLQLGWTAPPAVVEDLQYDELVRSIRGR